MGEGQVNDGDRTVAGFGRNAVCSCHGWRAGRRATRALLLMFALLWLAGDAGAAHITDKLVVGLYADQKLSGKPKRLLTSGTPIEVLKRGKGVVQVRLADDTRGWLEAHYVSEEKPAAMQLLEVQAELRRLKAQLKAAGAGQPDQAAVALPSVEDARAEQALAKAQARIRELENSLKELPSLQAAARERDELKGRLAELRKLLGVEALPAAGAAEQDTSFWRRYSAWIVAGVLALLGFVAGITFIDYRIRKRYGGLRL